MAFGLHLVYFLVIISLALVLALPQDSGSAAAEQLWDNVDVGAQQENPSERQARFLWGGGLWGPSWGYRSYWGYPSYRSWGYGYRPWGYGYRRYWW